MTGTDRPPEPPRLGVPEWVNGHTGTYEQMRTLLGEQPEWG